MSHDPTEQRRGLLESVLALGLLAEGDEPRAAALTRRMRDSSVSGAVDGPKASSPLSVAIATSGDGMRKSGNISGESLVESAHLEETTLVVAAAALLYRFTTKHHDDKHVDERAGGWTSGPLGESFAAWYPFAQDSRHGSGILELGDEHFLAAHGEADGAAEIAQAIQAARSF